MTMAAARREPLGQRERAALRLAAPPSRLQFHRLVDQCGGLRAVLEAPFSELASVPRLGEERARAIADALEHPELDRELDEMRRCGARLVAAEDDDYPANLLGLVAPPPLLYVRGALTPDDQRSVAIVGARTPTEYGRSMARALGRGLALAGVTVVSGFAQGIDTEAMVAAAQAGGRAVGVLGTGLSVTYPASSAQHLDLILQQGELVSEYPMRTGPQKGQFPERNSLIAGFTLATCVVEAKAKSGSLLTAEYALDFNRMVFAVPGDVTRENSRGCNALIRAGATLVNGSNDILTDLAPRLRQSLEEEKKRLAEAGGAGAGDGAGSRLKLPEPGAAASVGPLRDASHLSPLHQHILAAITHESVHLDALARLGALAEHSIAELSLALLDLELEGLVKQLPGKLYHRLV